MEYLISCLWIALEGISTYFVASAFLKQKRSASATFLILLLFTGLLTIHANNLLYTLPVMVEKCLSLCVVFVAVRLIFSGPWYSCLAVSVCTAFFHGVFDTLFLYGSGAFLHISLEELIWKKALYTMTVTLGKTVFLFLCWGLSRLLKRREKRKLSTRRIALTVLFPLISMILLLQVFQSYRSQGDLSASAIIFSFILMLANVALLYLLDSLDRAAAAEKEVALLNQSMALQTENYRALEKGYRAQRSASHEFKHQLQVIGDLLRDGNTREAQDYVTQLQGQQTSRIFAANTGNTIVDAILNEKYQRARENGVDISYKVNDLSNLKLSTDALVVLLSNLLENAIEACCRLPEDRQIECSLLLEESLFLSIRNTAPPVKIVDGRIETSKENKAEHGFGLPAVQRILKQMKGELVIDYSEPWFQVVAEIPNE